MRFPSRRSKIVCTLGPAVSSLDAIRRLIEVGMDVARLNFSHGTHETHLQNIQWIRQASKDLGIPVAILGDLQGPKIRTGKILDDAVESPQSRFLKIQNGQKMFFVACEKTSEAKPGNGSHGQPIAISYPRLAQDLRPGDVLLFDDGLIRMDVVQVDAVSHTIQTQVIHGTKLGENKGVNMPGAHLSTLGITEKDWQDIQFAIEHDLDFLALSFVRSAREVKNLKQFLIQKNTGIHVIPKIEMAEAIQNIDEILDHCDGLMVARGDLGVEIGNEKVPTAQKQLIQKARARGKPVITATQMLMSMVQNPSPSRAEASDIANAVLDGSDALMLSNETASGQYPLEAVRTMAEIIENAEIWARTANSKQAPALSTSIPVTEAIEAAATSLAASLRVKVLACLTRSGQAARQLAKYRPPMPIVAFAENAKVQRQLSLAWGVSVIPWKEMLAQDYTVFDELLEALARVKLVEANDLTVMTAGIPTTRQVGTTNTVVVRKWSPESRASE